MNTDKDFRDIVRKHFYVEDVIDIVKALNYKTFLTEARVVQMSKDGQLKQASFDHYMQKQRTKYNFLINKDSLFIYLTDVMNYTKEEIDKVLY